MIIVGEDPDKNPANTGYAQEYKTGNGYPDDMIVVSDPSWITFREGVSHASSVSLPFFAVLDSKMTMLYSGSDEKTIIDEYLLGL